MVIVGQTNNILMKRKELYAEYPCFRLNKKLCRTGK